MTCKKNAQRKFHPKHGKVGKAKKRTILKHKVIPNTSVEKNKCLGM
jgi:hypothetical protein